MAKAGTKAISATIPAEQFDALDDYRWGVRKNLSQVISEAVAEFITAHNIPVVVPDAPAAETAPEAEKPKGK